MNFKKIFKDGKVFYGVADTARLLDTNLAHVKELMGKDLLEWEQVRLNGRLIVEVRSIERCRKFLEYFKEKSDASKPDLQPETPSLKFDFS